MERGCVYDYPYTLALDRIEWLPFLELALPLRIQQPYGVKLLIGLDVAQTAGALFVITCLPTSWYAKYCLS